jgi:hypothetical protein
MRLTEKWRGVHRNGWAWKAVVGGAAWMLLCPGLPLQATTLVVKLESGRILLAADTRQERFSPGTGPLVRSAGGDTRCKVLSLGGIGFAVTGFVEYQGAKSADNLADWSASADALEAFGKEGNDIRTVAADWGKQAASHFALVYKTNPGWLKQLASANPLNILEVAFFTGWDKADPVFIVEIISYDPGSATGNRVIEQSRYVGDVAFSTNSVTQELIDGGTDRAERVADEWDTLAENVATKDLAWRHIEFYIKKTAAYDPDVSAVVDVLAIPEGKPAEWIQKGACK